jgi:single-stranded-DNA-specific exonuclease
MAVLEAMLKSQRLIQRYEQADGLPDLSEPLPLLERIYRHRGVIDSSECVYSLDRLLPASKLFHIERAAMVLANTLAEQSRILIVGDFDADGATSTALALRGLRAMGAHHVDFLVPNRFEYGYGLTPEIVEVASEFQPDLIITVDNGISSIDGVRAANSLGIQVLVTDHHLPGGELPDADVIVNPNQPGDEFESKNLAGVGVMFYVLAALRKELTARSWFEGQRLVVPNLAQWLDLVALGTVADVVPLDYNNRILVEQGLRRIRQKECVPGITALIQVAGRRQESLTASDLGFAVGPRLNAAGRLDDMSIGIDCLLTDDSSEARSAAEELDRLNRERRDIEQQMKEEALLSLEGLWKDWDAGQGMFGVSLYDEHWHQGVVGILASRVKEQIHRPVIAFARDDRGDLKGSARSIPGLHIRDALDLVATRHPGLLSRFGGHAMAAGLSLKLEHFSAFAQAFNEVVRDNLGDDELKSIIWSDGGLQGDEMNLHAAKSLQQAGPWGQGFPEPLFDDEFEIVQRRVVGERHLKLVLKRSESEDQVDGIAFFYDPLDWPETKNRFQLAYRLSVNEYQGRESVQLIIEYARALD